MTRRYKAWSGNYDGSRQALVIALNKKTAMRIIGCGAKSFADYYGELEGYPEGLIVETLYTRAMSMNRNADKTWHLGRCPLPKEARK